MRRCVICGQPSSARYCSEQCWSEDEPDAIDPEAGAIAWDVAMVVALIVALVLAFWALFAFAATGVAG